MTCWLIDDSDAGPRALVAQYAALCACELRHCRGVGDLPSSVPRKAVIAIAGPMLARLAGCDRSRIASVVRAGATLYIRGAMDRSTILALDPFVLSPISIAPRCWASAYTFSSSPMVPRVLREETTSAVIEVSGADCNSPAVEVLMSARHLDGVERAVIFAFPYGDGRVICDLHSGWTASNDPIVARLADPLSRHSEVGALIAVNQALATAARLAPFNLTIDDRPANHDHFNAAAVKTLLRHIDDLNPGAHTDFAWTPCYTRPARAYIAEIRRARTGFVWHGFFRHVDHTKIADSERDIARGKRAVVAIERRFDIRLQPIMVFPFERSAPNHFALLGAHGFLASVEEPRPPAPAIENPLNHPLSSLPYRNDESSGFTVLHRYPVASLTRNRLLAMSALGLPIIAYAHPDEVGLKRLSFLRACSRRESHIDEILGFVSAKRIPSGSLEQIALETASARPNDL